MSESSQTQAVVVLDASQVPAARALAAEHGVGVEQIPHRGIEPVSTVTLALIGASVSVSVVMRILDQHKGGQVVDLRSGAPKAFYRTPDVVYGTVIIVTVDGKVTVEVKEPDGMFGKVISTLPSLLTGGDAGAEQAAQVMSEAFGAGVKISTVKLPSAEGGV